jgi:hypothetical protein
VSPHGGPQKEKRLDKTDAVLTAYSNNTGTTTTNYYNASIHVRGKGKKSE